jgi:hypothetical protein
MKKIFYTHLYSLFLLLTGFASFTAQAQADLCSGANTLVLTNGAACTTYDINGFGLDGAASIGACDFGTRNMDAWSRFTAVGGSTTITFTSSNNRDVAVVVYNNATCTPLVGTQLGCADALGNVAGGVETVTVATTAGNSYLVRVVRIDGNQRAQGDLCIVANDICSNPIALTVGAACVSSTNSGATDNASGGSNSCAPTAVDRTVWYRFQATSTSHDVNVTGVGAAHDPIITVYSGICGALGADIGCADGGGNGGSETASLTGLTIGSFYLVRIAGYGAGNAGNFCINISTPPTATNDLCTTAIPLTIDATCVAGTTVGAINSTNPAGATNFACDGTTATDRTVWYSFVATAPNHTINLTAVQPGYNAVIHTYTGTCAGGLTALVAPLNCQNANGNGGSETEVLTGLTVGTTYFVRISGSGAGVAGTFCLQVVTPPPTNDTCAAATNLTVDGACINGYTIGATNNAAPTGADCGVLVTDRTVWYTFTATAANQTVNLTNLSATYDAVVSVYSGACGGLTAGSCINGGAAGANETLALTGLTVGTVYRIRISGNGNGNQGSFCINVTQPAPTNDICSAATPLTIGAACVNGTTIGATNNATPTGSVNFACDGTTPTDRTVWYSFTASLAPSHTITLNNNTALYDAVINVYSGTCAGTLTPVASGCRNAGGNGVGEALTLAGLINGTTYFVRISGFGAGDTGDFCLQVTTAPNDVCTTATVLSSNSTCVNTAGSTIGAAAGAAGCAGTADDDVWYSFTARTGTHTVTVTPTGGTPMADAVIELFSGTCAGLTSLACSNTTTGAAAEVLTFAGLIIGNNYFVKVHSFANGSGQGNFNICVTHVAPPNDNCSGAITLTPTAFCTIGTVIGATNEPTNDLVSCLRTEQTVWYRFVATQTIHVVRVQNSTGNFNLSFALYTGTCGSLTYLTGSCINDFGNGVSEDNTFTGLTVGTTYFVRVHNAVTNSQGDFCIQVYNVNPPNDNCETPTPLIMNGLCSNGDNSNATTGINNGVACGDANKTLWYSFVATQTSHYLELTVTNTGDNLNPVFGVYTGSCASLTTVLACQNSVGGDLTESQTLTGLTINTTYLVRISSSVRGNMCLRVASVPPNDNCTGAVPLTVNAPCTAGTNILATASASTISCGNNTKSVWYSFTATAATHTVTVNGVTGFDAAFALYNNTCGTPTQLAPVATYCRNTGGTGTTETNSFGGLSIGITYLIMVTGNNATAEGKFCIQVQGPPANDLCTNASSLTVNGSCTAGTNILAGTTGGEPAGVCVSNNETVWYTFTATSTLHTVNLTNVTDDLGFAVFSGSCATMALVGTCRDAGGNGVNETGTFTTVIGTQYWVRVAGAGGGDVGNFCIQVISPPVNDFCSTATPLTMNYPCVLGQNTGATNTPLPNPTISCGNNSQTVWYSFVATRTSHRVSAFSRSTGTNNDFVMNLYSSSDNTCAGTINSIGCIDLKADLGGEEGLFTGLTVGNTYYAIIAGFTATDQANFCISVTQDSDLCINAVPLSINSECVAGGNTSATVTAGETTTCAGAVNRAMWFSFVPNSSTTTINAQFNPDVDGRITVFNASGACTGMTQINCIDGPGNGGTEQLTLNQLSVGRTYYIMVDAVGGTGAFCIKATSNVPCGTNPQPSDECDTAPLVGNLNGYCGVTSTAYTANNYNNLTSSSIPFCNASTTIENNSFLRFTAASTTATFNLNIVSDAPFGGKPCNNGLQMQVLSVSGGNCRTGIWTAMPGTINGVATNGTCISESGGLGTGSSTVVITGLIPGQIYYIMFDGYAGQECGYSLSTLEGAGVLLPATMLSFSAKNIGKSNALHWATSSELEVDYFQIDRSYNGMQFESIGKVMAAGNSSRTVNYDFMDTSPLAANNFYRLTIFDKDGTRSFSKIIQLIQEKTEFSLLNLYPNPANQEITASIFSKTEGKGLVEIITIDGRVIMQTEKELLMNETELVFDIKNLVSGLYMLKITSSVTGTTLYQKFVKF